MSLSFPLAEMVKVAFMSIMVYTYNPSIMKDVLGELDRKFKASLRLYSDFQAKLGYTARPCLKIKPLGLGNLFQSVKCL